MVTATASVQRRGEELGPTVPSSTCNFVRSVAAAKWAVVTLVFLIPQVTLAQTPDRLRAESCGRSAQSGEAACGDNSGTALSGGWYVSKTEAPHGGRPVVSVMRTADLESDVSFAGLLLRCAAGSIDALMVVTQPYPSRTAIVVTVKLDDAQAIVSRGDVVPPGLMVRLPREITTILVRQRLARELKVHLAYDNGPATKGTIKLHGFAEAIAALGECNAP
jgi:hypothetical protein